MAATMGTPQEADNFWGTVFDRRFGGDLVGVREQLPYLESLGINAIYLNPVFWAASLHKYDATAYHHIDPTFGPDRAGDLAALAAANETADPATWIWTAADRFFLDLVADCHARGIRVILDGVFNHSGTGFFAFQDLKRHGQASRYADWYQIQQWHADGSFDHARLGRTRQPAQFRARRKHPQPRHQAVPLRRHPPLDGSLRPRPPAGRHRRLAARRRLLRAPRLLARMARARPLDQSRGLHHRRNRRPRPGLDPARSILRRDELRVDLSHPRLLHHQPRRHRRRRIPRAHRRPPRAPRPRHRAHHAEPARFARHRPRPHALRKRLPAVHHLGPYFNWPKAADNPALKTHRPGPDAKQALKLAAAWQFAGPGAPMLYYGTEVGMWGGNDPCDRQPMLWSDLAYEDETQGFRGPLPAPNPRRPDLDLFAFYQRLIALRKAQPALRRGAFRWLPSPGDATLVFERELDGTTIWCAIHKGSAAVEIDLPRAGRDLWSGAEVPAGPVAIPARGFRLIQR
jgi:cyclomaltodextrinase / maltogenic alpha-amylase / neopullulanase